MVKEGKQQSVQTIENELNFDVDYFEKAVEQFHDRRKVNIAGKSLEIGRYMSWEQCYCYFQSLYESKNKGEDISCKMEEACLRLAFYMASWGMYRGSSFLLQYNHMIFENVVDLLLGADDCLWNISKTLCECTDNIESLANKIYKIGESIGKELDNYKKAYFGQFYFQQEKSDSSEDDELLTTDTLITKLLLGTMGCIPAMDRFFKNAIKAKGDKFTEDCIKNILLLAKDIMKRNEKPECMNLKCANGSMEYPIMKLIDMYYFTKGNEDEFVEAMNRLDNIEDTSLSDYDKKKLKPIKRFALGQGTQVKIEIVNPSKQKDIETWQDKISTIKTNAGIIYNYMINCREKKKKASQ